MPQCVECRCGIEVQLGSLRLQLVFLLFNVIAYQREAFVFFQHFGRAETDAVDVDVYRAHHPPSARFGHGPPVFERIAGERVGRDGGHRVVEVLDLDGGQRDVEDGAVDVVFGHADPVSGPEHVIDG